MTENSLKGLSLTIPVQRNAENYYRWIYSSLRGHIGKKILEIGPGHGNMVPLIKPDCETYAAIDVDEGVISFLKDKFKGLPGLYFGTGSVADPQWREYFKAHPADTVVSLNVLEHIENPDLFIKQIRAALPQARLVLFVPALKWLYGSIDKEAGHYTRFTKKEIRRLFESNGLELEKLSYFNFVGAIGWFVCNRLLNQKVNSPASGALFRIFDTAVIPVVRFFDGALSLLLGQSIMAVGRPKEK